ncbi:sensor histidine kinase [Halorussus salinus]|uniref:sensor histidine kinase n=1 Tax=Halorussus salinus TaxID=1364935 RepID=UPI001091FBD9|nr:ATP-binding protein [Halorussus salinus]
MSAHEEILDRMTDAFFAVDDDWQFTYLNERATRILGRAAGDEEDRADLLGDSIWEAIPAAVDTNFYEQYHEAMRTQRPVSFEERYEPLDAWFEVQAYPSETGLSVYFRDISDRKRLEADLRRRDEVFRRVYRAIADKSATFEEKVESLLDIGRDALGTDYGALSRVEDDEYVFEVVRDSSGETRAGDTTPLSETNCERAVVTEETLVAGDIAEDAPDLANRAGFTEQGIRCYVGTPLLVDGQVYGTFCFYDDAARSEGFSDWQVTLVELMGNWVSYERERERREAELSRQRDRLDEFAHVISHDLRNPLNVAAGRLALVREDIDHEQFDAIEDALDRIEAIVDDTLTLAREGRTVSESEPVSLAALAEECWGMVASDRAEVEVTDSFRVRADPDRLRQVFENLFRNSVEHGSASGCPPTDDDAESHEEGVSVRVGLLDGRGFYVEDDGPGIPEADRESVFQTGYTTSDDGTGFGLAIVARIAEAHGWRVGVTEGTDGGARFEFENVEFA